MKKLLIVLVVLVCAGGALSALDMSAGLGGNFNAHFNSAVLTSDAKDADMKAEDASSHFVGGGFYAFFDATYVEADIGLIFGNTKDDKYDDSASDAAKKGTDTTHLRLALYGKYPIALGGFTLFPMAGIDGLINLSAKEDGEELKFEGDYSRADMFNQFWIRAGVGADIGLTEKIYLRPSFLYGIRFNTKAEKDWLDESSEYLDNLIGHGLEFRVAAGYKF